MKQSNLSDWADPFSSKFLTNPQYTESSKKRIYIDIGNIAQTSKSRKHTD